MKTIMNRINAMFQNVCTKLYAQVHTNVERMADCRGDLATNTIGAIIVSVVIIGILVLAVNAFFPDFFKGMFTAMQTHLNANW